MSTDRGIRPVGVLSPTNLAQPTNTTVAFLETAAVQQEQQPPLALRPETRFVALRQVEIGWEKAALYRMTRGQPRAMLGTAGCRTSAWRTGSCLDRTRAAAPACLVRLERAVEALSGCIWVVVGRMAAWAALRSEFP